jgi:hypothetical protein
LVLAIKVPFIYKVPVTRPEVVARNVVNQYIVAPDRVAFKLRHRTIIDLAFECHMPDGLDRHDLRVAGKPAGGVVNSVGINQHALSQ